MHEQIDHVLSLFPSPTSDGKVVVRLCSKHN